MHKKNPINRPIFRRKITYILLTTLIFVLFSSFLIIREKNRRSILGSLFIEASENLRRSGEVTNIAIMGVGGEGHSAPNLTDSMILISYNHDEQTVTTLSLPRDIWVPSLRAKLNTAYHYGEERREGGGIDLAKSAISETIGQPIHYVVVLEFEGFIEIIDSVGGIEVNVERTFDDYKYPIAGKETAEPESERYTHLHFEAGTQNMNGSTALQFARSRHAEGEEGTDFARSARQQKIISAFVNKVFSTEYMLNVNTSRELLEKISDSIDTDIVAEEYASFLKIALEYRQSGSSIISGSLEDYLETPDDKIPYDGQWVLIPIRDEEEIYEYVEDLLSL